MFVTALKTVALVLSTLLFLGCSSAPQKDLTPPPASVDKITRWETSGRVGIRTEQDAVSGNFSWSGGEDTLDLSIIGPFGQGATQLKRLNSGLIQLKYDDVTDQGTSANALLNTHFGWQFPVEQVAYWSRGLAAPSSTAEILYQADSSLPQEITQDGWTITYKDFSTVDGLKLPSKMQASNPPYRVNLIITEWTIQ